MRLPSARWLIALLPLAVLAVSFLNAPYLTAVRGVGAGPEPLTATPVALYRHESTEFFYTSADLIHPEAFAPAGFIQAVVFDIFPATPGVPEGTLAGEVARALNQTLVWVSRFEEALAGDRSIGQPADRELAAAFRRELGGATSLPRGAALLFDVPAGSAYGTASGIRALAALGTRPAPGADVNPLDIADNGSPQLFDQALDHGFRDLAGRGVRAVGVPRMIVRDRIGDAGTRAESWAVILAQADATARAAGLTRVLFGGWGIDPRARAATDAAFRDVWAERRRELLAQSRQLVDERTRVGALLAFAALAGWVVRGRSLSFTRLVALLMIAGTTALTIAALARWAAGVMSMPPAAIFAIESALALAAGAAIEQVVQFDPRKSLAPSPPS